MELLTAAVDGVLDVQSAVDGVVHFLKVLPGNVYAAEAAAVQHRFAGNFRENLLFANPVDKEAQGNSLPCFQKWDKPRVRLP